MLDHPTSKEDSSDDIDSDEIEMMARPTKRTKFTAQVDWPEAPRKNVPPPRKVVTTAPIHKLNEAQAFEAEIQAKISMVEAYLADFVKADNSDFPEQANLMFAAIYACARG